MGSFSIRHTASCNFSEYDPEAIPYLGHLPQDLTGNSVFDCYHPEDLPLLKEAYEESECGCGLVLVCVSVLTLLCILTLLYIPSIIFSE